MFLREGVLPVTGEPSYRFVGDGENTITFYGLRIDGYSPPCP